MKTITQWAIVILVLLGLAGGGAYLAGVGWSYGSGEVATEDLGGNANAQGQRSYLTAAGGASTEAGEQTATTTNIFLGTANTASSSIIGQLDRGDQIDVKVRAIASSSAGILHLAPYVSDNGVDWYAVAQATSTTNSPVLYQSGYADNSWGMSTSSMPGSTCGTNESCTNITLSGFWGKFYKIDMWVTGANAAVHAYGVVREQVPN